ncbi:MAG: penicillin-binding protein activator, partial [Gammaproteobacteria bacterium]|nr:penicillin-binding protein activator [Gammaproteobacteria bacterium]
PGAALRDGFIAAYFDYGDAIGQMDVVVYDTARLGAAEAYRLAVADGAEFVVGPLQKNDVAEVARLAPAGPTTLALNYLPAEARAPKNFYQYALAPEHEAVVVAQHAVAAGRMNAVALVPAGDWGERLLDAFATELNNLGGQLLAHNIYQPDATDFSSVIRPVLHLDRSYSRSRALASAIGQPIEFEPRRRRDVDFVFIAAQPKQARLIRPQLRFHYATALPVYATAAAYSPDTDLNRDINGLIIAATPWEVSSDPETQELRSTIDRYWPGRAQHRSPLYAMGYDAWRLIPLLSAGGDEPMQLTGVTGELSLLEDGRIQRTPMLTKILGGIPAILEPEIDEDVINEDELPEAEVILPGASGSL